MNQTRCKSIWLVVILGMAMARPGLAPGGESPTNAPPTAATVTGQVARLPVRPFILPPGPCPVQFFRELLAKNPLERIQLLSGRPAATQALILAKIREYQALNPDQRELRLGATELRWYLWPLMNLAPTNRAARLAMIPLDLRPGVEERLREWDKVPPSAQNELRDNEPAIRHFMELSAGTPEQQQQMLQSIPPARREQLEAGIRQWQNLPEGQRQKIVSLFEQFFDLRPKERDRTLRTLSDSERQQIEKTLEKFALLSAVRRALCLRSFNKFASLSLEERAQFLKNAERWDQMTPSERQAWRDLVAKWRPQPPRPPDVRRFLSNSLAGTTPAALTLATNRN